MSRIIDNLINYVQDNKNEEIKKTKNLSTEIPFGPHMVIGCILYVVLIDEIFKFLI